MSVRLLENGSNRLLEGTVGKRLLEGAGVVALTAFPDPFAAAGAARNADPFGAAGRPKLADPFGATSTYKGGAI